MTAQSLAIPTRTRLAHAIQQHARARLSTRCNPRVWWLIILAHAGYYDEYPYGTGSTDVATPILNLVYDLRALGFTELAQRTLEGEFDASENEVFEWMDGLAD